MNWISAAVAATILLGFLLLLRVIRSRRSARASYTRQDFLLSPEERQLFTALKQAVGDHYAIFARIHVTDIIAPRATTGTDAAWDALDDAGEVYFPFVLCKLSDLSIACAIQLVQHKVPGRNVKNIADHPLKDICGAAGLPLLRMEASPFYDRHDIRQAIAEAVRREPLFISETDGRKEPTIAELEKLDLS
ncbi:MAG: hypothetical protein RLZZ09_1030 [Pseudomonadota bacterium]|jgi:hypothetical protein